MLKTGRIPSKPDRRDFRFARYVDTRAPHRGPPARDWMHPEHAPAWGMFGNDTLGDCTCAAIGHLLQAQAANSGRPLVISTPDIIRLYCAAGGYVPGRPETDRGAEMRDVLKEMQLVGMCGVKFGAYVAVDPRSPVHVEIAINLTGGLYVGLDMPIGWKTSTIWDHGAGAPNSWDPHAVMVLDYNHAGLVCVTWAGPRIITWAGLFEYCSEAYAGIDDLWIQDGTLTPSGFDRAQLLADLNAIDRGVA